MENQRRESGDRPLATPQPESPEEKLITEASLPRSGGSSSTSDQTNSLQDPFMGGASLVSPASMRLSPLAVLPGSGNRSSSQETTTGAGSNNNVRWEATDQTAPYESTLDDTEKIDDLNKIITLLRIIKTHAMDNYQSQWAYDKYRFYAFRLSQLVGDDEKASFRERWTKGADELFDHYRGLHQEKGREAFRKAHRRIQSIEAGRLNATDSAKFEKLCRRLEKLKDEKFGGDF